MQNLGDINDENQSHGLLIGAAQSVSECNVENPGVFKAQTRKSRGNANRDANHVVKPETLRFHAYMTYIVAPRPDDYIFLRRRLIFVGPQCGTCLTSPFRRIKF